MRGSALLGALVLLGVAFLSALVPLVNLELYLGGVALTVGAGGWWSLAGLALVAALGQMGGKMLFFFAGRGSIRLPARLRRKAAPKDVPGRTRQALARWRVRVARRPAAAAGFVLLSASAGMPPFALVAVAAGSMRISWPVFLLTGTLGRWVRFAAVLGAVELLGIS